MNRKHFPVVKYVAAAFVAGALVSACGSSPAPKVPTQVSFASNAVVNVDATSMDVNFAGAPSRDYPHVGHRSPVSFEAAAKSWADKRFDLTGNTPSALRVTIKEGDLVEELLPVKTGLGGAFKKEQAAKYEATLEVELQIVDAGGKVVASASGKSWNTHTVPEDATETDKQIVWAGMVKQAFDSLDQELIPRVYQGMRDYVR